MLLLYYKLYNTYFNCDLDCKLKTCGIIFLLVLFCVVVGYWPSFDWSLAYLYHIELATPSGNTTKSHYSVSKPLIHVGHVLKSFSMILCQPSTPVPLNNLPFLGILQAAVCLACSPGEWGAVRHTLAWEQWSKAPVCLSQSPVSLRGAALNSHYRHFTSNSPHDLDHTTTPPDIVLLQLSD